MLPWTGERMVPFASDLATQLFHYQRYLFFRPWYEEARIIDAACGEGYGTGYAATFAESALGVDISDEAVQHAITRYPHAKFEQVEVNSVDYSKADLVISFETIEHLDDPEAWLDAVGQCPGRIVISTPNRKTHSPGNARSDQPHNNFHTIEWTPNEFAELIRSKFSGRTIRFLSQEGRWPGLIREGLDDDAMYCIAVIGEGELPIWPKLGLAMPTLNNVQMVQDAIVSLTQFYPGELEIALVANGSNEETVSLLKKIESDLPHIVHVVQLPENVGYGRGANAGLAYLTEKGGFDLYGVVNDDILASVAALSEMVMAHKALVGADQLPGILGPVTNRIHGEQKVDIGDFNNLASMMGRAEIYHREHHSEVTQHFQLRGYFFLITPDCLEKIGGFDPRFGLGNFEDDDYCLRAKLAGYTNWIVNGSFIFHHGSQTFAQLEFDDKRYDAQMERNREMFLWKWDVSDLSYWPIIDELPDEVSLHQPFDSTHPVQFSVNCNGEWIDLLTQASDIEFTKWVFDRLKVRHRDLRNELVAVLMRDAQRTNAEGVVATDGPHLTVAS